MSMPLLYGEGLRAFIRLQEEIIRYSNDKSILLHGVLPLLESDDSVLRRSVASQSGRLLAESPSDFARIDERTSHSNLSRRAFEFHSFTLTNSGLQMEARIYRWKAEIYAIVIEDRPVWTDLLFLRRCTCLSARYFYPIGTWSGSCSQSETEIRVANSPNTIPGLLKLTTKGIYNLPDLCSG